MVERFTFDIDDGYVLATDYDALAARLAEAEAKIDALMLEYCPDEMTQEQVDRWMAHQVAADSATGQESDSHE